MREYAERTPGRLLQVAIVEEAGELLESQIMAAVASPRLEHLILIGRRPLSPCP